MDEIAYSSGWNCSIRSRPYRCDIRLASKSSNLVRLVGGGAAPLPGCFLGWRHSTACHRYGHDIRIGTCGEQFLQDCQIIDANGMVQYLPIANPKSALTINREDTSACLQQLSDDVEMPIACRTHEGGWFPLVSGVADIDENSLLQQFSCGFAYPRLAAHNSDRSSGVKSWHETSMSHLFGNVLHPITRTQFMKFYPSAICFWMSVYRLTVTRNFSQECQFENVTPACAYEASGSRSMWH